ncbi:MAG: hypothetical protein IPK85_12270 [Gemmatimonadetes bacterium]|nr:hypothetical protein [Gemmatimonadota bacterium]
MTPEPAPLLVVHGLTIGGRWAGRALDGIGGLVIERVDGKVATEHARVSVSWRSLADATLERGTLTLYQGGDVVVFTGSPELPRAWGMIVERACPMPEFARGLRTLGRRGSDEALESRFFGPLLAARRRVANPDAVERRVAQFDTNALADRWRAEMEQLAAGRFAADAPRRRALAAHLEEAIEPCLAALEHLASAGDAVFAAPAGTRFDAWRRWTGQLRRVFIEADRAWHHVSLHLS